MRTYIISLFCSVGIILGTFGCSGPSGPAHNEIRLTQSGLQGVKKIAVVVEQKHNFEVIHSRATTNIGAPLLLGGLAGVEIASGIDEGKDKNQTALMAKAIQDVCCPSLFIESLSPLSEPTRFDKVYILPDANQKVSLSDYDAVVTFTIARWGLRLIERETDKVAAFVELDAKMVRTRDANTIWDQREVIIGDRRENLATYSADSNMLRNELRETIKKAGFQMSNALIYQ